MQIRNPYTNVLKTAKTVSLNCPMFGKGYMAEMARIFDMFFCEHRDDIHVHTYKLLGHSRTHQHHCPQIKILMMLRFCQGKWNWFQERPGRPFRYATSTWPSTTAKATRSCQGYSVPITRAPWSRDSIKSPLSKGYHEKLVLKNYWWKQPNPYVNNPAFLGRVLWLHFQQKSKKENKEGQSSKCIQHNTQL